MGKRSEVDWTEIMKHSAVTAVTTMTLSNTAKTHDAGTDERLLNNLAARAPRLRHILDLSMAAVNAKQ